MPQLAADCLGTPTIEVVNDSSSQDLRTFCINNGVGRHEDDNDCAKYIYCYAANGMIYGQSYTCSGKPSTIVNGVATTAEYGEFSNGYCRYTRTKAPCV